jgi:phosphatidylserine synthase
MMDLWMTTGPILAAEALITWTVETYYIAAAVVQCVALLIAFKIMQLEEESNTFVGVALAVAIINISGYFLRDTGIFGMLVVGAVIVISMILITAVDVVRASVAALLIAALYAGLGHFVIPRTPLTVDKVGGVTRVVMTGGLEPEPMTEQETQKIMEATDKDNGS